MITHRSINLGFINLDKPINVTSHDCVAKIRRWLKIKQVGHGGTLDPAATGVLPIAVGKATRLLQYLPNNKAYQAKIRFGYSTTTDDLEGEIIETQNASDLTLEIIQPHLSPFLGKITQVPPLYSAIQKGGKRLYELARAGKTIDIPPREVEINQIEVLHWEAGDFPELTLNIECQSGTYIRSLARDLGKALQTGGTLVGLRRTKSNGFTLENSLSLSLLEQQLQGETFALLSPDHPLQHLEKIDLWGEEAKRWCQGQKIGLSQPYTENRFFRVYGNQSVFLGVGETLSPHTLKPKTVINTSSLN